MIGIAPEVRRRIALYGSPMYLHTFGAINAGADEYVSMGETFPGSVTYAPLTNLLITNRSGEFVDLEINGKSWARLPAGTIGGAANKAIWSFRLTNNDSTNIGAGEITANINTPPANADELARLRLTGEIGI